MEAKGAAERKAATEALQAAWAAAEQVRPGVGAETTGAVQVRRAEERCKEAERATKLGDAEVADAHRAQGHPIFNLDGSVHLEEEEQRMAPEQVNAFFNLDGLL